MKKHYIFEHIRRVVHLLLLLSGLILGGAVTLKAHATTATGTDASARLEANFATSDMITEGRDDIERGVGKTVASSDIYVLDLEAASVMQANLNNFVSGTQGTPARDTPSKATMRCAAGQGS